MQAVNEAVCLAVPVKSDGGGRREIVTSKSQLKNEHVCLHTEQVPQQPRAASGREDTFMFAQTRVCTYKERIYWWGHSGYSSLKSHSQI